MPPHAPRLRPLSRDEVRRIDVRAAEEFGMPTVVLMENAGRGAAEVLFDRMARTITDRPPRVLILCGPGNNGGDGAVVARHLDLWGCTVKTLWFADPARLKGDALTQYTILNRAGFDQSPWTGDLAPLPSLLAEYDWLVDALLGTGLTRPVSGVLLSVVQALNASRKPVLSLDLPSGLDADTGLPLGDAVRATVTTTFVAPKSGFANAGDYTGEVEVVGIGVPRRLLEGFGEG